MPALKSLAIHKVLLRLFALSSSKFAENPHTNLVKTGSKTFMLSVQDSESIFVGVGE